MPMTFAQWSFNVPVLGDLINPGNAMDGCGVASLTPLMFRFRPVGRKPPQRGAAPFSPKPAMEIALAVNFTGCLLFRRISRAKRGKTTAKGDNQTVIAQAITQSADSPAKGATARCEALDPTGAKRNIRAGSDAANGHSGIRRFCPPREAAV